MNDREIDEILGIIRCERCGHRLDGEIECPFCSIFHDSSTEKGLPKWVYLTACFLTSPFSIYYIVRSDRLKLSEKILAVSGSCLWLAVYLLWS